MACACKNKIKRLDDVVMKNFDYDENGEKNIAKMIISSVILVAFKLLFVVFALAVTPFVIIFVCVRILFFPNKKITINLQNLFKKWRKISG